MSSLYEFGVTTLRCTTLHMLTYMRDDLASYLASNAALQVNTVEHFATGQTIDGTPTNTSYW